MMAEEAGCGESVLDVIAAMRGCGAEHSWREIGEVVGLSWEAARGRWRRRPDGGVSGPCPVCGPFMPEGRHKVVFEEEGNSAEARSESERIRTLDGLLKAAEVDLEVWEVRDWGVKKWEVGAKLKEGYLTWLEGRIEDGHLDYKGLGVQDLWSVWAKLVRREPVAVLPVVRPVLCEVTYRAPEEGAGKREGVRRSLVFADPQFGFSREFPQGVLDPFHDRAALDVVLQIAGALQPERIDILGDFFDFVMWTDRFLRSPRFEYTTQPAIMEGHWWLRQLREACPGAVMKLHEGNHDKRMKNSIMTHLRAAYGIRAADEFDMPPALSPERLLALDALGVEWVGGYPDDEDWLTDELRLMHGDVARNAPGATARAVVEGSDVSTIFGHIHRKERVSRTVFVRGRPRTTTAYCPGCVCRIDGAVPGKSKRQNWQQGLAVVTFAEEGFSIDDVEIREGRALWDGRVLVARERVEDLRRDVVGWSW